MSATSPRACPNQSRPCATVLLHLSHNLEEPRPRRAEGNGPAIVGATKGRSLRTFRGEISKSLAQFSEPASLNALVTKLWLKSRTRTGSGGCRMFHRGSLRIECICTEEFCSIPNNHCLGASKCCDWSCNWPWWIVRLKSGLRWRTGRNNRTRVKCCRNVDGSQLAGASR